MEAEAENIAWPEAEQADMAEAAGLEPELAAEELEEEEAAAEAAVLPALARLMQILAEEGAEALAEVLALLR